jgi:hypothetical protein
MLSNAVMNDSGVRLQMAFANTQDVAFRVALTNSLSIGGIILGGLGMLAGILLLCTNPKSRAA